MPFVKGSPVWRMVESLEVFRIMPQKPHFQPLFKCKELEREGFAIGQMVKFAEVVERTSKLRGYSPFDVFYSCLEALADLKMHGFDVEVVVCRINDLLLNKERLAQLQNQAKEVDIQIAELTHERSNLEEDIEAIDKKIRELEAKRALAMSMKERKDSEIFDLQTRASAISAHISKACHDFASLSGAP
ncbi:unnamed protein product [Dovyalis caffra]|uniref:Uncharacterized protein n=1 Tax=Dovyalis caffra TaxID=77055 RepID=A0AAV1SUD9_9ROSI|nr:unnamed protein product [Dovyalis caffra]